VRGTLFTVQKALPLFNDDGSIIMTGSVASVKGFPSFGVYAASKAALRSFARTWLVFLSSDDEEAVAPVADLAKQLGFAPVKLGKLNEGGWLVHARGRTWGQLIFQDVFKKQQ
jgi:predicted dinucleotide-binding enzyme